MNEHEIKIFRRIAVALERIADALIDDNMGYPKSRIDGELLK